MRLSPCLSAGGTVSKLPLDLRPRRSRVARAIQAIRATGAIALLLLAIPIVTLAQQPNYILSSPTSFGAPGDLVQVRFDLDSSNGMNLIAVSIAVCNVAGTVEPITVDLGLTLASMNGGLGPEFIVNDLAPNGFSSGIIFSLAGALPIPPTAVAELLQVDYQISFAISGVNVPLTFCVFQGVSNDVVEGLNSASPTTIDGEIVVSGVPQTVEFIRGDVSEDGSVSITDAIVLFGRLLGAVPDGLCPQSGDVNADGTRDIADVVSLLSALFIPGAAITPPFPACGTSTVPTGLACSPTPICP